MYKVYSFPTETFLTEEELGIHIGKVEFIEYQITQLMIQQRERPWREQARNRDKYESILKHLKEDKDKLVKERQKTIGLVNSKEKAKKAIQYYVSNNTQYQRCEFEIVKAKK